MTTSFDRTTNRATWRDLLRGAFGRSDPSRTVPLVDVVADYRAHRAEIDEALASVLDGADFILGEATERFEREFAAYCGTAHAIGVDSGYSAIELIVRAFGIGPGDEVITAANTFYSTVRAIEATGAAPVLVDVDPRSRNLDPNLIEAAITASTRAIFAVHLYGHPADMATINQIAGNHGLYVFEDACQAHGSRHHGDRAGGLGDAAAFSFYPSKNLGGFGDGGMVVTDRPDVDEKIRKMRNLGSAVKYRHDADGFNRRLDSIQAAVLRVKLRYLDHANEARRRLAATYTEAFSGFEARLPVNTDWAEHVYHLYVIEVADRERVAAALDTQGIGTGIHYPVPIHLQPAFESLGYGRGDFPVTEALAQRILSLPMHPYLTESDVGQVADAVRESCLARSVSQ